MPRRDSDYYRDNGDLVVLVEETLFRVHSVVFMKEPSMFSDMASFPSNEGSVDSTTTDEAPLPLSDDTADEFRALCWVMYALPDEITALSDKPLTLDLLSRLLSVALISNKYQFVRIEKWASNFLEHYSSLNSGLNFPMECTQADLSRLIRYSITTDSEQLKTKITNAFLRRMDGSPTDPNTLSPIDALRISEEYLWRDMQGKIYYRILCEAADAASDDEENMQRPSTFQSYLPQQLSPEQISRLMQGYCSLHVVYNHVSKKLSVVEDAENVDDCPRVLNMGKSRAETVDVLGRLRDLLAAHNINAYGIVMNREYLVTRRANFRGRNNV